MQREKINKVKECTELSIGITHYDISNVNFVSLDFLKRHTDVDLHLIVPLLNFSKSICRTRGIIYHLVGEARGESGGLPHAMLVKGFYSP